MAAVTGDLIDFSEDVDDKSAAQKQPATQAKLNRLETATPSEFGRIISWINEQGDVLRNLIDFDSDEGPIYDTATVSSDSTPHSHVFSASIETSSVCVRYAPQQVGSEKFVGPGVGQFRQGSEQTSNPDLQERNTNMEVRGQSICSLPFARQATEIYAQDIDRAIKDNLDRIGAFFVDAGANTDSQLNQRYVMPGVTKVWSSDRVKDLVTWNGIMTAGWKRYAQDSGGYNVLRGGTTVTHHQFDAHELHHGRDTGGYDVGNALQTDNRYTGTSGSHPMRLHQARPQIKQTTQNPRTRRLTRRTVDVRGLGS